MNAQMGLFGQPDDPPSTGRSGGTRPVRPHEPDDDLRALAARLDGRVHLGTSSWSFPGWRGIVWSGDEAAPSATRLARGGLDAYARHPILRAVGIDRTFYAPVDPEQFTAWAGSVPESFRFLVKAGRNATMERLPGEAVRNAAFLDPGRVRAETVEPARAGLGPRLGVVVVQFPPQRFRSPAHADAFLDRLDPFLAGLEPGADAPIAIEVRNGSLLEDDRGRRLRRMLEDSGVTPAFTVHPSMPSVRRQAEVLGHEGPGPLTVRWMLCAGETYESARDRFSPFDRLAAPDRATREDVASVVSAAASGGRTSIVIANNKAEGCAPLTSVALAEAIVSLEHGGGA